MSDLTRRELLKAAGVAGAAAMLPSVPPDVAEAQTTQKRELVVAQGGDIAKFDPHFSTSSNEIRWTFNLFDNLVSRHPDGKLYPGLATEWKLTNPTTWTFKLRPGVKWHDGAPFTSGDVAFTQTVLLNPDVDVRGRVGWNKIARVETRVTFGSFFTTSTCSLTRRSRVSISPVSSWFRSALASGTIL